MSTTRSAEGPVPPAPGLRERKKARTRFEIQQEALRLFRENGYAATTVEQIAEAAEVSPSTFFRYFPTKASVVLTDDYDPIMVERLLAQPGDAGSIRAIRTALRETFAALPGDQAAAGEERGRLMMEVPELRAALLEFLLSSAAMLADAIGTRVGRSADDPEVVALSSAAMGVMLAAMSEATDSVQARLERADRLLGHLEDGFSI